MPSRSRVAFSGLLRVLVLCALAAACTSETGGGPGGGDGGSPRTDGSMVTPGSDGGSSADGPQAVIDLTPRRLRLQDLNTLTLSSQRSRGQDLKVRWDIGRARFVSGDSSSPAPQIEVPGTQPITVALTVTDARGRSGTASASAAVNQAPSALFAEGNRRVRSGQAVSLDASPSRDPEGDPLTFAFRLVSQPPGASAQLTSAGASVTLTPAVVGAYLVEVTVSDGMDEARAQTTVLAQSEDRTAPTAGLAAAPSQLVLGESLQLQATVADDTAVTSQRLLIYGPAAGAPQALMLQGTSASYTPPAVGRYRAELQVADAAGNRQRASAEFFVRAVGSTNAPMLQAEISDPDDSNELTRPTDIRGSASGQNFAGWVLELRPRRLSTPLPFVELARGASAISAATFTRLDTTRWENDTYELRLTAYDTFGTFTQASRVYAFSGPRKVGGLSYDSNDAEVHAGPLTLNVNRSYSSLRRTPGDFGYDWRMQLSDTRLEVGTTPGEGWSVSCAFFGGMTITPLRGHRVTLRLAQKTYRFFFNPQPKGCFGFVYLTARFDALPGTTAQLLPDGSTDLSWSSATNSLTLDGFGAGPAYSPSGYTVVTEDGFRLHFNAAGIMDRMTDATGQVLVIDKDGVRRGASVDLRTDRDSDGRITALTLADGRSRSYRYDGNGDLTESTDFEGAVISYRYDSDHDLIGVYGPGGRPILRGEYDADGRLIALIDGNGRRSEYTHRLDTRQEISKDRLGRTIISEYDEDGNIVKTTAPDGAVATMSYDAAGRLLRRTDPLGNQLIYSYDADGNLLTITDPLNRVTTMSYDAAGRLLSRKDPAGRETRYSYDASGHLLELTLPGGAKRTFAFNANGDMTSQSLETGLAESYTYNAAGRRVTATDSTGTVSSYSYDRNGYPSGRTYNLDTGAGVKMLSAQVGYTRQGLELTTTAPEGGTAELLYNIEGSHAGFKDPAGLSAQVEFNGSGLGSRIINPGGTVFTVMRDANDTASAYVSSEGYSRRFTLDARDNLVAETDSVGNVTRRDFDAAGRVVAVTDPAGARQTVEYDAAGQIKAMVAPGGARTEYGYSAGGDVVSIKDAIGRTFTRQVSPQGETTALLDSGGKIVNAMAYDPAGRLTQVTVPSGATQRYEHGPYGVERIIDPLNNSVRLKRNASGAVTQITDARGKSTRLEVDSYGVIQSVTLPSGARRTQRFDTARHLTAVVDYTGATTNLRYDALGRLVAREASDGTKEEFGYSGAGLGPATEYRNAEGVTRVETDPDGRLLSLRYPDGATISYRHEAGRLTEIATQGGVTRYSYDSAGRVNKVTAPGGQSADLRYDVLGRLVQQTLPGGVTVTREYDPASGLLIGMKVMRGATATLVERYEHDVDGHVTKWSDDRGRTRTFRYDGAGRLVFERSEGGARTREVSYSYDEAGNRLTRTEGGVTATYRYDDDGRLLSDGTYTYQYDAAGRLTSRAAGGVTVQYRYSASGRLIEATRSGDSGPKLLRYSYDPFGGLRTREVDGKVERYLNDYSSGLAVVLEEQAEGATTRNLYWNSGGRPSLWGRATGAALSVAVSDRQGSIRQLCKGEDGTTLGEASYDAFGVEEEGGTLAAMPYRFAGERRDDALGLYDLRARRYDPASGRFLSRDPVLLSEDDPRVYNAYHYANSNPLSYSDYDGRLAMLGYLLGLEMGQKGADAAAIIFSAAMLDIAAVSFAAGNGSGRYSTSILDFKIDPFKAYLARLSFQDGSKFAYAQLDGAWMETKKFGAISGGYKFVSLFGIGEHYGVFNEFIWEGIALWTEVSNSYRFFGVQAGAWIHSRWMMAPFAIFRGGGLGPRRSNVGGAIGSFGVFTGFKYQVGNWGENGWRPEAKIGLGIQSAPSAPLNPMNDGVFDCIPVKLAPIVNFQIAKNGELCLPFGGGGGGGGNGPPRVPGPGAP